MRSRLLRWSLLAFQFFWLNIVVPGHARGVVQVPGASAAGACPLCHGPVPGEKSSQTPVKSSESCAICNFAAHLSTPPAFQIDLPPLHFLHAVENERAASPVAVRVIIPYDGRGPPFA